MDVGKIDDVELVALEELQHHRGFKLYLMLLEDAKGAALQQLRGTISTAEEQAAHNKLVGFVEGIQKAASVVDFIVEQLQEKES